MFVCIFMNKEILSQNHNLILLTNTVFPVMVPIIYRNVLVTNFVSRYSVLPPDGRMADQWLRCCCCCGCLACCYCDVLLIGDYIQDLFT